jgi:hypothetical protein
VERLATSRDRGNPERRIPHGAFGGRDAACIRGWASSETSETRFSLDLIQRAQGFVRRGKGLLTAFASGPVYPVRPEWAAGGVRRRPQGPPPSRAGS